MLKSNSAGWRVEICNLEFMKILHWVSWIMQGELGGCAYAKRDIFESISPGFGPISPLILRVPNQPLQLYEAEIIMFQS